MPAAFRELIACDATREQLEEWCRSKAQAIPVGSNLVLCRVLGKYILYALARDYALTPHLALDGIWEPWVTMAIARHIKPGMRCLDVGACYGYYSVLMADTVGGSGQVDAWEPYHCDLLQLNASLNGFNSPRLVVHPHAMGWPGGEHVVVSPPASNELNLFNAGGVEVTGDGPLLRSFQRRVETHLPYAPEEHLYDFIKVDVEGHEAEVWKALALSYAARATVCMEFTPKKHADPSAFLHQITQVGFALGTVGHDGTPRACSAEEALEPDTGDFRMLWLTR